MISWVPYAQSFCDSAVSQPASCVLTEGLLGAEHHGLWRSDVAFTLKMPESASTQEHKARVKEGRQVFFRIPQIGYQGFHLSPWPFHIHLGWWTSSKPLPENVLRHLFLFVLTSLRILFSFAVFVKSEQQQLLNFYFPLWFLFGTPDSKIQLPSQSLTFACIFGFPGWTLPSWGSLCAPSCFRSIPPSALLYFFGK